MILGQMTDKTYDLIVVGGGAAGFFAAINTKERLPHFKIAILEKTRQPLAKVRISGGGRCNVTHHCFDPKKLVTHYPRGEKELLGPFNHFSPTETVEWFQSRGVALKTEEDGRMFPVSDSSESIAGCLHDQVKKLGIELHLEASVTKIIPKDESGHFELVMKEGESLKTRNLLLATGSSKQGWEMAASLGHKIVPPVPSLFTFNCPTSPLLELSGIAVPKVRIKLVGTKLEAEGPCLITHWGFSGPAVLRLSAFGARLLHEKNYHSEIEIDWQPYEEGSIPKNLLKKLDPLLIHKSRYQIEGKTTFKYEFTTAGGITLKEVNFKTCESKVQPGLYFSGEILDVDGITGGFNFQNAWTTGWLVSQNIN